MLKGDDMRESDFQSFLTEDGNIKSKTKAVNSRLSKARLVERHFDICLDTIVSDDEKMFDTLVRIKQEMKDTNGNVSNALRKYYAFSNGKRFPTLADYRKDIRG